MKYKKEIQQAETILEIVSRLMNVSVSEIKRPEKVRRFQHLVYTRKLIVYAIRNFNGLRWSIIAELLGFARDRATCWRYYTIIRASYKVNNQVRGDVAAISKLLKQLP